MKKINNEYQYNHALNAVRRTIIEEIAKDEDNELLKTLLEYAKDLIVDDIVQKIKKDVKRIHETRHTTNEYMDICTEDDCFHTNTNWEVVKREIIEGMEMYDRDYYSIFY